MYKMKYDEAEAILKLREEEFINNWNQTRYIIHSIYQSSPKVTEKLSLKDVLLFPWEEKDKVEININPEHDIKYMIEMEKKLNNNNG